MNKTIFLDIDGCVLKHKGNLSNQLTLNPELLPDVIEKLNKWEADGCKIILVTGRKESMRKITEETLASMGVFFDQLIMGLPRGERIVINDQKPDNNIRVARAIEIKRNEGLTNVII
jgi:hypothetical protein